MRVSVLTDLPGRSVATTSAYTTKLESFDEIRTRGKSNFESELLELATLSAFRRNNYLLTKLEHQMFREV